MREREKHFQVNFLPVKAATMLLQKGLRHKLRYHVLNTVTRVREVAEVREVREVAEVREVPREVAEVTEVRAGSRGNRGTNYGIMC